MDSHRLIFFLKIFVLAVYRLRKKQEGPALSQAEAARVPPKLEYFCRLGEV